MDRRGFRPLPEHEQVWAVPVSQAPAAYNLRGHLADLTQRGEEENVIPSHEDGHAFGTQQERPFRAKQKVHRLCRAQSRPYHRACMVMTKRHKDMGGSPAMRSCVVLAKLMPAFRF